MNVCQAIARRVAQLAYLCNSTTFNPEGISAAKDALDTIIRDHMPSGSGFDNGTSIDDDASRPNRLVFKTAFHHMDEHGCYDGWTHHTVIVTPAFEGFSLRVTGRDRNGVKNYIADVFYEALHRTYVGG